MNEIVPDFYNNKDLIFDEIWTLLSRGVVDRSEDFRLPVIIVNKGEFSDGTGTPAITSARTLTAGDYRMVFPIPQGEINIFTGLQQNPDY